MASESKVMQTAALIVVSLQMTRNVVMDFTNGKAGTIIKADSLMI
jgi:hypothetical protein